MYLSRNCDRILHIPEICSKTGGNEALLFRSYTLVLSLLYMSYLCSRLLLPFTAILHFSLFEQSFQVPLMPQKNVEWLDLTCRFLVEHTLVSQLCFRLPFRYQVLSQPQNQYPSGQQLLETIRSSNALAVYQRFKLVFTLGQLVGQLLYSTWSVVIWFVAWDAVVETDHAIQLSQSSCSIGSCSKDSLYWGWKKDQVLLLSLSRVSFFTTSIAL